MEILLHKLLRLCLCCGEKPIVMGTGLGRRCDLKLVEWECVSQFAVLCCAVCVMKQDQDDRDASAHNVYLPEGQVGSYWQAV